jgi:uncharacterized membrane protein
MPMRNVYSILAAALSIAGCGQAPSGSGPVQSGTPAGPLQARAMHWEQQSPGQLALIDADGGAAFRILCPGGGRIAVNVPTFQPIGSEERLSFGSGGNVVALVADISGDKVRGGVTGEGVVPDDLRQILSGPVSASYGSQVSGPHPALPAEMVAFEVEACEAKLGTPPQPAPPPPQPASPCLIQDGRSVPANGLKAVGTEPFWGARIEGRCVTYSTPENQAGTRVWTRFSGSRDAGIWIGSLDGEPFELRTSPSPSCSDGMSDRRYPVAVTLTVNGERRTGCAEPL